MLGEDAADLGAVLGAPVRDAEHLSHACVQAGIGELAFAVEADEGAELGFIQAAVGVGGGEEVLEDGGAGVLRGLEEIADDAAGDAGGPFVGETLAGEDG